MAMVGGSDLDNWGCVFLGFEVVTALTDVIACLQTWALKTGLLSLIRADTRERERRAYVKVSMPHTGRRQEQRGRAQIPPRLVVWPKANHCSAPNNVAYQTGSKQQG